MTKLKRNVFIALLLSNSSISLAQGAHSWHDVVAQNGTWRGTLQAISEEASFVTPDGASINHFTLSPGQPIKYGFIFGATADFNVAYTLTLTQIQSPATKQFTDKTCVYVISAKAPAEPDIHALSYNGANCAYQIVPGVGENYTVG